MKAPLSWLKEFAQVADTITIAQIEESFINSGFEVESVEEIGKDITGPLVVAKVVSIEELTGHKKPIRYVGIDCGEGETRFVICGARNFEVGDHVVAALPGAVLPGNFAISARETYDRVSDGMICSARELGISQDHTGIINLPKDTKIGANAIEVLEIEDVIFDISVTPDRGYALSIRGLARELAGAYNMPYHDPIYQTKPDEYQSGSNGVKVNIDDPTGASDIFIRTIENFDLDAKTPLWMSRRIEKCGMRSISLAVDITNYVMLELGQPLHAFDADKINGSLNIRRAGKSQTFQTLDGQDRELSLDNLVVADDENILALAGTMGGASSEISESTVRIALEGAHFIPNAVALNSRVHRLSTEASRRLERGVDPKLAKIATSRGIDLLIKLGSAKYLGTNSVETPFTPTIIELDPKFVDKYLSLELETATIREKLEQIGCQISTSQPWKITVPSWRPDLNVKEDLVEEIARLVGYDKIPSRLPIARSGAWLTTFQIRKREIAKYLVAKGFTEVLNFPFTNKEILAELGFVGLRADGFIVANPISEEYPMFRTHILPGLLETALRNKNRGVNSIAIFEIGTFARGPLPENPLNTNEIPTSQKPTEEVLQKIFASIPNQPTMVAGLVGDSLEQSGWWGKGKDFTWEDSISLVAEILSQLKINFQITQVELAPWHPGRCAEFRVDGVLLAHAGQLHPKAAQKYGLPSTATAFGIILDNLPERKIVQSKSINTLPATIQDVSLTIPTGVLSSQVEAALLQGAGELIESVKVFDRYENPETGEVSLGFTLTFRSPDKTLTNEEVSIYREQAVAFASAELGVKIRTI